MVPVDSSWMRRVASIPSTPGICRSMSTMSGCSFEAVSTAASPSVTTSITRRSCSLSSATSNASPNDRWSSAITTVMGPSCPVFGIRRES